MKTAKQKAWYWCSRYCRLRDALEYCARMRIDTSQFSRIEDLPVQCCTCKKIQSWIRMDAGHWISRSSGGRSGVYFDERNIHAQSKDCNAFYQGRAQDYYDFMLKKYGQEVIDELKFLDKNQSYKYKIVAIGLMYQQMYEELLQLAL